MRDIFHYDLINQFNQQYYKNIINVSNIVGDELAIKHNGKDYFYFPIKKDNFIYLLRSEHINDLPLRIIKSEKISFKSKAYQKIVEIQPVKIKAKQTVSYKDMIDAWLPYEHDNTILFTLWKIIVDTAYSDRINVRAISFPGWLKDSPLVSLQLLRGDTATVNKPSLAKLKYLLNNNLKVIGINEVQSVKKEDDVDDLAKFYEDTGDFKPEYVNPKRSTGGTSERSDITNMSTLTFYNFPEKKKELIFDQLFHPKIRARVFPLFLDGGSHESSACKHKFGKMVEPIKQDEMDTLKNFIHNHKYYEDYIKSGFNDFKYNNKYRFGNVRWERNFITVCQRIAVYAQGDKELYDKLESVLYNAHIAYVDYANKVLGEWFNEN